MEESFYRPPPRAHAGLGGRAGGAGRLAPADVIAGLDAIRQDMSALLVHQVEAVLIGPAAPDRKRSTLIKAAIDLAVGQFIDLADGRRQERRDVALAFRRLGQAEAEQGDDMSRLHATWYAVSRRAWQQISRMCNSIAAGTTALVDLGNLLFDFLDELFRHAKAGFQAAKRPSDRARLGRALMTLPLRDDIQALAARVDWRPPDQVIVCVVEHPCGVSPDLSRLGGAVLAWPEAAYTHVVFEASLLEQLQEQLVEASAPSPIAIGWPVPLEMVGNAVRWGHAALELRHKGQLPPDLVIHCREWLSTLLLGSEPMLRDELVESTLAPLVNLGPHDRLVLGETLLHWLMQSSAPRIAAALNCHPNTVRHRVKLLRMHFGVSLDDPGKSVGMLIALTAALPDWRNAHERSRRARRRN